jgi:hypothetical protein
VVGIQGTEIDLHPPLTEFVAAVTKIKGEVTEIQGAMPENKATPVDF